MSDELSFTNPFGDKEDQEEDQEEQEEQEEHQEELQDALALAEEGLQSRRKVWL